MLRCLKASTAQNVRFVMVDSAGAAITTLTSGTTTVEFCRPGDTSLTAATKTNFVHIGKGVYQIQLSSSEVGATVGNFLLVATGGSALQFSSDYYVTANLLDDVAALVSTVSTNVSTVATNVTTIINRLGAFAGTGVNTVLGFFRALLRTDATLPTDVAGTYDPALHSTQAIAGAVELIPVPHVASALVAINGNTATFRVFGNVAGVADTTATQARVTVYNPDGTVAIAQQTDATPDAHGTFNITVSPHGLAAKTNYLMLLIVDTPDHQMVTYQGFSTA